jgi:hypothetical protein
MTIPMTSAFESLNKLAAVKSLWVAAMPTPCPLPEDFEFLLWLDVFPTTAIEYAVLRTAKKMRLNLRQRIPLVPNAAQRYCTSVLKNYGKSIAATVPTLTGKDGHRAA